MAEKLKTKYSKEFQVKLRREVVTSDDAAIDALMGVLRGIAASGRYDFRVKDKKAKRWPRHGERYDTLPSVGLFKSSNISLATEKGVDGKSAKTKLKCKLHNFVPELLYKKVDKSYCVPSVGPYGDDPDVELKFKLEQDIHFDNCKYAATGYLIIPGRDHKFKKVSDFLPYYQRLTRVPGIKHDMPLVKVKDWQETVYDDLLFYIGDWEFKGALVTRRDTVTGDWDETEFSFKIKQPDKDCEWLEPADGWDYGKLQTLAAIYNEMFRISSVFIQSPSIFYFSNPVSSRDIRVI